MKKKSEKWAGRAVYKAMFSDILHLAMPILIYAPIYMIWFIAIEKHTFTHYSIIHTAVDDMIPFVGIVLAIIIFIGGHIANFLFQVLGAGVNALRLNYVEFFAQFYMGGKHSFEAFKAKRQFTKIKK